MEGEVKSQTNFTQESGHSNTFEGKNNKKGYVKGNYNKVKYFIKLIL
jgi:hypothetical protein